jgi:prepilin-type N-terminal cleavage/methylation domain-containing protein
MKKFKSAFSLLEISIVVLIIGILISGISTGIELYQDYKINIAKNLTQNSRVGRIDGLVLWLESSQKSSFEPNNITNGTRITKWKNINPNISIHDRQKNDALVCWYYTDIIYGPKFTENGINQLPSLEFKNNEKSCLNIASTPLGNSKSMSLFLVFKNNNLSQNILFRHGIRVFTHQILHYYGLYSSNYLNLTMTSKPTLYQYILDDMVSGKFFVNKTNININQSGTMVPSYTPTGSLSTSDRFHIGSIFDNLIQNPEAFISEIIIFDRALNDSERNDVVYYLNQKWGLNLR